MVEVISPEIEVDIEPHPSGSFVRLIDITEGKIFYSKITPYSVEEIKNKLKEKMKEVL